MDKILGALAKRAGQLPASAAFNCKLANSNQQLNLECQVGNASLSQPVLVYKVHKIPSNAWVEQNRTAEVFGRFLGIEVPGGHEEGGKLSIAQQRVDNLSKDKYMLLPNLAAGAFITAPLRIPAQAIPQIQRVEVRVLSAEGSVTLPNIMN